MIQPTGAFPKPRRHKWICWSKTLELSFLPHHYSSSEYLIGTSIQLTVGPAPRTRGRTEAEDPRSPKTSHSHSLRLRWRKQPDKQLANREEGIVTPSQTRRGRAAFRILKLKVDTTSSYHVVGDSGVARCWSAMNSEGMTSGDIVDGYIVARPLNQICILLGVGTLVCHAIRTQGIGLETRSLLGGLTMQDRIIPCKHDFILRLGLDM